MFKWIRELLEIRYEFNERKCQSCEILKKQLEIVNFEKRQLLDKLLQKPEIPKDTQVPMITSPKLIPWNIRKQMLEQEDREKARILRDAPKPSISTEDLEKELKIVTAEREKQTGQ